MEMDSETPQKQQTHATRCEAPHTVTVETERPSPIMSVAPEAPQIARPSTDEDDQSMASTMSSISEGSSAQMIETEVIQPFPFLKLPRELCDKIYRSVLVWRYALKSMNQTAPHWAQVRKRYKAEIEEECEVEDYYDEQKCEEVNNADYGPVVKEGTLRVNKQIHEEAYEILIKENEIVYEEDIVSYDLIGKGKRRVKRPLCEYEYQIKFPGIFKQAREIRADFSTWGNALIGDFVQLILQNPNLRSLHVAFCHPSVPTMKEIRKEMKKFGKINGLDRVSLSIHATTRAYCPIPYADGTKREKALMDFLKDVEKKMLAK